MRCPNCDIEMSYKEERQDVGKYLGCTGCLACLVTPLALLLMPLAFLLPKKKYYVCPKCSYEHHVS